MNHVFPEAICADGKGGFPSVYKRSENCILLTSDLYSSPLMRYTFPIVSRYLRWKSWVSSGFPCALPPVFHFTSSLSVSPSTNPCALRKISSLILKVVY